MALPAILQPVYDRLKSYNGTAYNATTNPRGFARGGNQAGVFIAMLRDVAAWGSAVVEYGVNASANADTAAAGASTATTKAAEAKQSADRAAQYDPTVYVPNVKPAFHLVAREGEVPSGTTLSRATAATRTNRNGVVELVAANNPRVDYDPFTGVMRGLLIERATTRINTISATPTVAETVNLTPNSYTLSFYGSGSVALSGTVTATIEGAGPYPSRRVYTFFSSNGALTLTPSGDVRDLQIELGITPTSVVRGEGSQVPRAADAFNHKLESDFNPDEGTVVLKCRALDFGTGGNGTIWQLDTGLLSSRILINRSGQFVSAAVYVGNFPQVNLSLGTISGDEFTVCFAWKRDSAVGCLNGGPIVTGAPANLPSGLSNERIGQGIDQLHFDGAIKELVRFPRRLSNAEVQKITGPYFSWDDWAGDALRESDVARLAFANEFGISTVTPDLAFAANRVYTLIGNVTFGQPINAKDGLRIVIYFIQDSTGSRTLTFNSAYHKFPGGTVPTLSTAINAVDRLTGICRSRGGVLVIEWSPIERDIK